MTTTLNPSSMAIPYIFLRVRNLPLSPAELIKIQIEMFTWMEAQVPLDSRSSQTIDRRALNRQITLDLMSEHEAALKRLAD